MMRLILPTMMALLCPAPLLAMTFERCDKAQIAYATAAVEGARDLALIAGAAVGDTPIFARWFGTFTPAHAEQVRTGMKAVNRALRADQLHLVCPAVGLDGCDIDIFANVMSDEPYRINLCSAFFSLPTMTGVVPTSSAFDSGTREGTIIHEVSHFDVVAGTEDHWYTRTDCAENAKSDPRLAIENADSFQYYSEDVLLTRQGRID